ncbi:MAG TPA: PRC-barrel domain-containing protein [Dermatophilaceae bacterium]|nr:PRC-barrel domain-containing protein [Dermatophilaceae bacterium]
MSVLVRARELIGRPVVTLDGDDIAQVKDLVFDNVSGQVDGFTLNGRGAFAGPLPEALAWEAVYSCGPDAVMIRDRHALTLRDSVVTHPDMSEADVLGSRVISEGGRDLGQVVDVIVLVASVADVVGYEIESSPELSTDRRHLLIPLPDTLSVSGEALIVPEAAIEFVSGDFAEFGAAVEAFRARLRATT